MKTTPATMVTTTPITASPATMTTTSGPASPHSQPAAPQDDLAQSVLSHDSFGFGFGLRGPIPLGAGSELELHCRIQLVPFPVWIRPILGWGGMHVSMAEGGGGGNTCLNV